MDPPDLFSGYSPLTIPDLTGIRTRAKQPGSHVATRKLNVQLSQLQDLTNSLNTTTLLPVLDAAWAYLFLSFSEAEADDIIFQNVSNLSSEYLNTPLRLCLAEFAPNRPSVSDVINKLNNTLKVAPLSKNIYSLQDAPHQDVSSIVCLHSLDQPINPDDDQNGILFMPPHIAFIIDVALDQENDSVLIKARCSNSYLTPDLSVLVLEQFEHILCNLLNNNHTLPFHEAAITSMPQHLSSIVNPNPPREHVPPNRPLIHHQFEDNARDVPDRMALWFKTDLDNPSSDTILTYDQLNRKANQIAHYLHDRFHPSEFLNKAIPLSFYRAPELYIAILATLKAGGAWCPVDITTPIGRMRDLLDRAGGKSILVANDTDAAFLHDNNVVPSDAQVVPIDHPDIANYPDSYPPQIDTQPHHLAYLIWTSGTTGAPKGVPITHDAVVQSISFLQRALPYTPDNVRCVNFSHYTFDVSILDFFYSWGRTRGTLCSAPRNYLLGNFVRLVNAFKATHTYLTPAFMAQITMDSVPTIECLCSLGEKLPDEVADLWCRQGVYSFNAYGPSEATILATYRRYTPEDPTKAHNVGVPLDTVSCFAMKDGHILPRGAVGELALGGHQNSLGYLNQPDKTAEKFIDHPIAGKVYLTGDIVRILFNGTCEFVGRNDDLIKIGGIRIELSEISTALVNCHANSREVYTMQLKRTDRPHPILCSFVTVPPEHGATPKCELRMDETAVTAILAAKDVAVDKLPTYMRPTAFLAIDKIPQTPSNKVDRKALTALYENADLGFWEVQLAGKSKSSNLNGEQDESWSELESKMRKIVSLVSGAPEQGITKSIELNVLGIDSIRALSFVAHLNDNDINLSVTDVIESKTISNMAKLYSDRLDGANDKVTDSEVHWVEKFDQVWKPIVSNSIPNAQSALPCTPTQEGMLGESMRNKAAYWAHNLYELSPGVYTERMKDAWVLLTGKTEMLRTVFKTIAEFPTTAFEHYSPAFLQVVVDNINVDFTVIQTGDKDIRSAAKDRSYQVIEQHNSILDRTPWAVTIFQNSNESPVMMLSMHHSLYDAESLKLLIQHIEKLYASPQDIHQIESPSNMRVLSLIMDEDYHKTEEFWSKLLTPFKEKNARSFPSLLQDDPNAEKISNERFLLQKRTLSLPRTGISSIAQACNGSVSKVIQAAWSIILSSFVQNPKIVFAETLSVRISHHDLQKVVAPLISTIPAPVDASEDTTIKELVHTISSVASNSMPHRHVSLGQVKKILDRKPGTTLFPCIFVVSATEQFVDTVAPANDSVVRQKLENVVGLGVEHPMALSVDVGGDEVKVTLEGRPDLLDDAHAQLILEQLDNLLLQFYNSSKDIPIRDLIQTLNSELLSIQNIQPKPSTISVLDTLEKCENSMPKIPAVHIYSNNMKKHINWTYGTLANTSNTVAQYLHNNNIHNKLVGICTARAEYMVAVQIGILKSGNSLLPVNSNLTPERQRLILRQSRPVITFADDDLHTSLNRVKSTKVVSTSIFDTIDSSSVIEFPREKVDANNICYVTYTNLSSGTPTPIAVTWGKVHRFLDSAIKAAGIESSRLLCWAPLGDETNILQILLALAQRSNIVSVETSSFISNPEQILRSLDISHVSMPPSLALDLAEKNVDLKSLRVLYTGDVRYLQPVQIWRKNYGKNVKLVQAFSFSNSAVSTAFDGASLNGIPGIVVKLGGSSIALKGEAGELCLPSEYLETSYQRESNRLPVKGPEGGSFVKTGIFGRMLHDNNFKLLGDGTSMLTDKDSVTDSAYVSNQLRPLFYHEGFDSVVLALTRDDLPDTNLIAFVAPSSNRTQFHSNNNIPFSSLLDFDITNIIKESSSQILPDSLLPQLFVKLDYLPIQDLFTGKINVKLLELIFLSLTVDLNKNTGKKATKQRQFTPTELKLATVISKQCGVATNAMHPSTTTLELGIDSIGAISLSFKFKDDNLIVPPQVIMSGPSIEKMAKICASSKQRLDPTTSFKLPQNLIEEIKSFYSGTRVDGFHPCLPLQEALIAQTISSQSSSYINNFQFKLHTNVDKNALRKALEETILANDIFRTCFYATKNDIVQVIINKSDVPSPWWDNEQDIKSLETAFDQISSKISSTMHVAPPIRTYIHQDTLCITMHHALYDGQSFPEFLNEILARYHHKSVPNRAPLSDLLNFIDSVPEQEYMSFYSRYLDNVPAITGPSPSSFDTFEPSASTGQVSISLSKLQERSKELKTSVPTLVQTAFGIALSRAMKTNDAVFGVVLSGRLIPVEGIDNILAPCITTVPCRVSISDKKSCLQLAQSAQADQADILTYQHVSLRKIQRWVKAKTFLFNSLFVFNQVEDDHKEPKDSIWTPLVVKSHQDYPLVMAADASSSDDTLNLKCVVSRDFEGSETIASELVNTVKALVEEPQTIITPLDIDSSKALQEEHDDLKPFTEIELVIREVISQICEVDVSMIKRSTSFFQLGIDSISSIKTSQVFRKQKKLHVPANSILQHYNIGSLARSISSQNQEQYRTKQAQDAFKKAIKDEDKKSLMKAIPLLNEHDTIQFVFPATPLQAGMLMGTLTSPTGKLYLVPHILKLSQDVNLEKLHNAWQDVVDSMDILRCSFVTCDSGDHPWVGACHSNYIIDWKDVDQCESIQQGMEKLSSTIKIDETFFQKPPLFVRVINTPSERFLVVYMHHCLYDGISLSNVFKDVASAYMSRTLVKRPQFLDAAPFVLYRPAEEKTFWAKYLDQYKSKSIDSRYRGASVPGINRAVTDVEVPGGVQYAAKKLGATLHAITLLAWGITHCKLTNSRDVVFGEVVAGRSIPLDDAFNTCGPLFNTIPFRFQLPHTGKSISAAVKEQQSLVTEIDTYQHTPLRKIQLGWQNAAKSSDNLLDSLFVYQVKEKSENTRASLWTAVDLPAEPESTEYPLNILVVQEDERVQLRLASSNEFISAEALENAISWFKESMLHILSESDALLNSIDLDLDSLPETSAIPCQSREVAADFDVAADNDEWTEIEKQLRDFISSVTKTSLENIKRNTPLYSLGLDSISAIQVASRCRKAKLPIQVADIASHPTIQAIAQRAESRKLTQHANGVKKQGPALISEDLSNDIISSLGLTKDQVEIVLPVLAGQHAHLCRFLSCGKAYYEPTFTYQSDVKLDDEQLLTSVHRLRERHTILRTQFYAYNSKDSAQVVTKIILDDTRKLYSSVKVTEESNFENTVLEQTRKLYQNPSTLFMPSIRVTHVSSPNKSAVLITVNHALYDAMSIPKLIQELSNTYLNFDVAELSPFNGMVEHVLRNRSNEDDKKFWKAEIGHYRPTLVHERHNEPKGNSNFFAKASIVKDARSIEQRCNRLGINLQAFTLAVFGRVSAELTQSKDPVVGMYHAGRTIDYDGVEDIMGPCVNVLPLGLPQSEKVTQEARQVQEALRRRVPYEQSFEADAINSAKTEGGPLYNIYVNLLWHGKLMKNDYNSSKIFKPMKVGLPSDFAQEDQSGPNTSVESLATSHISKAAIFVDLALKREEDSINIALRADASIMSCHELENLTQIFADKWEKALYELEI